MRQNLGAIAVQAAVERSGIDPATVYEVLMGNVISAGAGQALARQAALNGGLPNTVGATAVNKVCGSGLKTVMMAAKRDCRPGSRSLRSWRHGKHVQKRPIFLPKARQGYRYGNGKIVDSVLEDGLWCSFQDWVMGDAAEFIGKTVRNKSPGDGRICAEEP